MASPAQQRPRIRLQDPTLRERDERLDALKTAIGKMAHDFNNILAPMSGYVTLIKEEASLHSPVYLYASGLENAARSASTIVENILLALRPQRQFSPLRLD